MKRNREGHLKNRITNLTQGAELNIICQTDLTSLGSKLVSSFLLKQYRGDPIK